MDSQVINDLTKHRKAIALGKNSLAVTLPKEFVEKYNIKPGDSLPTHYQGHCFVVVPNEIT